MVRLSPSRPPWNFNPRFPRGERRACAGRGDHCAPISIHAPREGSDASAPPRGGRAITFQSTLPVEGAPPRLHSAGVFRLRDFNPRSPWGERPDLCSQAYGHGAISIHTPREGSDIVRVAVRVDITISTHAPREGSDLDFNSPAFGISGKFQSTLPARGATCLRRARRSLRAYFNPRSPRGERRSRGKLRRSHGYFNPRSPRGERHDTQVDLTIESDFNPRSPRGERPPT